MGTVSGWHFQVSPEIFDRVQVRLWLGHSRIFTELSLSHSCIVLAVCLGSLSCWKVNLQLSLPSRMLWTRFSLRISLYFAPFSFPSTLTSPLVLPLKNTPQHDAATTMLHHWDSIGQVMNSAWFPPDMMLRIEAKQFNQFKPDWWSVAVIVVLLEVSPIFTQDQPEWPTGCWTPLLPRPVSLDQL